MTILGRRKGSSLHSAAGPLVTVEPSKSLTLLWGATGEQEWTPALTTGKCSFTHVILCLVSIILGYVTDITGLYSNIIYMRILLTEQNFRIFSAFISTIYSSEIVLLVRLQLLLLHLVKFLLT